MLTKAQQLMVEDGAPLFCFLTTEQRMQSWLDHPPVAIPQDALAFRRTPVDPELLAELEVKRKAKASARIAKMLLKKEDFSNKRWDARNNRWISEEKIMTDQPQAAVTEPKLKRAKAKVAPKKKIVAPVIKWEAERKILTKLLQRPSGCNVEEVLKATGWKTVGIALQAKAMKIKIIKEQTDKGLRYYAK